jgi:hypothetical protein
MKTTGNASFTTKTWEETPYIEVDSERKLTRTRATFVYEGDLQGESTMDYLMSYCPNGLGSFVGLERFVGRLGGRLGSFVIQHTGTFDAKSVATDWDFVPGSATDELTGLHGGGKIVLAGHGAYPISFEYDFS